MAKESTNNNSDPPVCSALAAQLIELSTNKVRHRPAKFPVLPGLFRRSLLAIPHRTSGAPQEICRILMWVPTLAAVLLCPSYHITQKKLSRCTPPNAPREIVPYHNSLIPKAYFDLIYSVWTVAWAHQCPPNPLLSRQYPTKSPLPKA